MAETSVDTTQRQENLRKIDARIAQALEGTTQVRVSTFLVPFLAAAALMALTAVVVQLVS